MTHTIYKFDLEAALSMSDLRAIYKNKEPAQDLTEYQVNKEDFYDNFDDLDEDEESGELPYQTIGQQTKQNMRWWARNEKRHIEEPDSRPGGDFTPLFNELFNKLRASSEASTFKLVGSYKNRKNAPYRVFFDLSPEATVGSLSTEISEPYRYITSYLKQTHAVEVVDYVAGIARQVKNGKACDIRIGKFLSRVKDDGSAKKLLQLYINDSSRALKSNQARFKLMISRSPMDIIGASTTTSWESCLNLHPERGIHQNREYTPNSIINGQMVAYLVKVSPPKGKNIDPEIKFVGRKLIYPAIRIPKETNELLYELASKYPTRILYQNEYGEDNYEIRERIPNSKVLGNLHDEEFNLIKYLLQREYNDRRSYLNFPLYSSYKFKPSLTTVALVLGREQYGTWNDRLDKIVNKLLYTHHNAAFDAKNPEHLAFVPLDLYFRPTHFVKLRFAEDGYEPMYSEGLEEDAFYDMFAPDEDEEDDYPEDDEDDEDEE